MINFTFLNKVYFRCYDKSGCWVYWSRIEEFFKLAHRLHVKKFKKYFPHTQVENKCLDDEMHIEMLAERCGYKVIDEDIQMTKSGYVFERLQQ